MYDDGGADKKLITNNSHVIVLLTGSDINLSEVLQLRAFGGGAEYLDQFTLLFFFNLITFSTSRDFFTCFT